jgi:hypothetical protein
VISSVSRNKEGEGEGGGGKGLGGDILKEKKNIISNFPFTLSKSNRQDMIRQFLTNQCMI